jgi:tetratricopeptide (TPR) repeat protein
LPTLSPTENARLLAGVLLLASALLGGCASLIPQTQALRETWPENLPERVELTQVPFFPQREYQCGPAALATALAHRQAGVTPDDLVPQVYLPARQGSLQTEMLATTRRYSMVAYPLAPRFEDVLREVAAGNPVIILQNYGVWPLHIWHYAVVVGYDNSEGKAVLRSGVRERVLMPFAPFEYFWKKSDYWAMVTMPPDQIPVTATEPAYLDAIRVMERVGDKRAVRTAYATFVRRWPDNVTASVGLANSHYALGELRDAETVLRAAHTRHPDSVAVLNNLAQTLADRGKTEEALGVIQRAVQLGGPLSGSVLQTREGILSRMKLPHGPGPSADPLRSTRSQPIVDRPSAQ